MKKIGREVHFLPTGKQNPRNGEGTFIRLKDGGIMYAFTEYYGEDWEDSATARISACCSYDEGETWGDKFVLFPKEDGDQNNMSVNMIRMNNGDLGALYLRKAVIEGKGMSCMPVLRRSSDEGKTWSDYIFCTEEVGYYCPFNGSALKLRSGRILMPVSFHGTVHGAKDGSLSEHGAYARILYSDDDGYTWQSMKHIFVSPYTTHKGLAEPSVYEHEDGSLWIWFRTVFGHQYQSVSHDGGETWSEVTPNFYFTSPDAPMQIRRVGPYAAAVFNPIPYYAGNPRKEFWESPKRTPLVCSISKKDGVDFSSNELRTCDGGMAPLEEGLFVLEDDLTNSFCYPSLFEGPDYFLVSYYCSNNTPVCLNCAKITKVMYSEIQ